MKTYIALLRGINVSGKNKVPMAELRALLSKLGFANVQTYIQTGNIIFQSANNNTLVLAAEIEKGIQSCFGFQVPVLVLQPSTLHTIFNKCPFPQSEKENSYFILLFAEPNNGLINDVLQINYPNETFSITNKCVYFYCKTGYGKAKCNNNFFEQKLKVTATARNYKTMLKLLSLSTQ